MKRQKNDRFIKILSWLIAEVLLNLTGLDTLADYSEFISGQDVYLAQAMPINGAIVRLNLQ